MCIAYSAANSVSSKKASLTSTMQLFSSTFKHVPHSDEAGGSSPISGHACLHQKPILNMPLICQGHFFAA
jgi:hypothetical protein